MPPLVRLEPPPVRELALFEYDDNPRSKEGKLLTRVPFGYQEANYILHNSVTPQAALHNLDILQQTALQRKQRICWRKRMREQRPTELDKDHFAQKVASRGGALHSGNPSAHVRTIGAAIMSRMLDEDPEMAWGTFTFDDDHLRSIGRAKSEQPFVAAMAHANVEVCRVMFNHPTCETYLKDDGEMDDLKCGLRSLIEETHIHINKKIRGKPENWKPGEAAIKGEKETPQGCEVLGRRYQCLQLAYDIDAKRHGPQQRIFEEVMQLKTGLPSYAITDLTRGYIRRCQKDYAHYSADWLDTEAGPLRCSLTKLDDQASDRS